MKKLFKYSGHATAVIVALSVSSCARFDTRMQANGSFEYDDAELVTPYSTGDYSNVEARNTFDIPRLTKLQETNGFQTDNVDIRPPTQLMAVIDGVNLEATKDKSTKLLFNTFNHQGDMHDRVWQLLESYIAKYNTPIISKNEKSGLLETGILTKQTSFGGMLNENEIVKEASYLFTVNTEREGLGVALTVEALSYNEINDGVRLKTNLVGPRKKEVEMQLLNDLLEYAYYINESEQYQDGDIKQLSIKLGFDDNHQNAWIVDSEFIETWVNLPTVITLLNFEIVESDKNLGYFLVKFTEPSEEYWIENNLKPFELEEKEYFIQLGELTGGTTSISWLDEDKKRIPDQKVTELYLSITEHIRDALIENESQTREF